jgi:hypothetical protein
MFPSADTSACSPLPSNGYRGRSLRKPCGSPPSRVLWGHKTAHPSIPIASGFPWRSVPPVVRRRWGALLGSWEIPLEACPELGTPAIPARPRNIGPPDAAFRLVNSVGIATSRFSELNLHGLLPCCVCFGTHQSPGEWQHSLPACLLDCGRAGLTPAGFHQEVSPSHLRFLLFQAFPSAMTMPAVSSTLGVH